MNNPFFRMAIARASSILGNRKRLIALGIQLSTKLGTVHLSKVYWKDRLYLIGRLLKAYANGSYRAIPIRSILLIVAAIVYLINPLDLIPDAVIGVGLTDDLTILTGVYNLVSKELDKFKKWEVESLARL